MRGTRLLIAAVVALLLGVAAWAAAPPAPLFSIVVAKRIGYVDRTGRIVINPQFDEARDFANGLAKVQTGAGYGYVDKTGRYVYNPTK